MDSTQKVSSLAKNSRNPRRISKDDFKNLVMSIERYGDLSGIVKNLTTGQLVGGHQRVEAFKSLGDPPIQIVEKFEQPNSKGTVARGFVVLGDEKYSYREVQWDGIMETQANIAANRIQGEWDSELLAELTAELDALGRDAALATGQTDDEINALLNSVGALGDTESMRDSNSITFHFDPTQLAAVNDALYKSTRENGGDKNEAMFMICRAYLDSQELEVI